MFPICPSFSWSVIGTDIDEVETRQRKSLALNSIVDVEQKAKHLVKMPNYGLLQLVSLFWQTISRFTKNVIPEK